MHIKWTARFTNLCKFQRQKCLGCALYHRYGIIVWLWHVLYMLVRISMHDVSLLRLTNIVRKFSFRHTSKCANLCAICNENNGPKKEIWVVRSMRNDEKDLMIFGEFMENIFIAWLFDIRNRFIDSLEGQRPWWMHKERWMLSFDVPFTYIHSAYDFPALRCICFVLVCNCDTSNCNCYRLISINDYLELNIVNIWTAYAHKIFSAECTQCSLTSAADVSQNEATKNKNSILPFLCFHFNWTILGQRILILAKVNHFRQFDMEHGPIKRNRKRRVRERKRYRINMEKNVFVFSLVE